MPPGMKWDRTVTTATAALVKVFAFLRKDSYYHLWDSVGEVVSFTGPTSDGEKDRFSSSSSGSSSLSPTDVGPGKDIPSPALSRYYRGTDPVYIFDAVRQGGFSFENLSAAQGTCWNESLTWSFTFQRLPLFPRLFCLFKERLGGFSGLSLLWH